jgi:uncharacterized protein (TIGR00369 family)
MTLDPTPSPGTTTPSDPVSEEYLVGFNAELGIEIAEWREDYVRLELRLAAKHLNRAGIVHGGVLATLIDAAGGYAGVYWPIPGRVKRAVTLSMNSTFVGQASSGVISCVGRRLGGGKTVFMTRSEVTDAAGRLLAYGDGVYRHIGEAAK